MSLHVRRGGHAHLAEETFGVAMQPRAGRGAAGAMPPRRRGLGCLGIVAVAVLMAVLSAPLGAAFSPSSPLSLAAARRGSRAGRRPGALLGARFVAASAAAGVPPQLGLGQAGPKLRTPAKKLLGSKRLRDALRKLKLSFKSKLVSQVAKESRPNDPTLFGSKRLASIARAVYGDEILNGQLKATATAGRKTDRAAAPSTVAEESDAELENLSLEFGEVELMWMVEKWKQEEGLGFADERAAVQEVGGIAVGGKGVQEGESAAAVVEAPWMAKFAPDAALRDALSAYPETSSVSDYTLGRFYELSAGDPEAAANYVRKYVEWQNSASYGVERVAGIDASTPGVAEQIRAAKCYLLNKDSKDGCPIVLVRVCRHNPDDQTLDETTRFVCYALAEAEARLKEPERCQYSVLFDMTDASMGNVDYQAVKRFVFLLTNYCPARLNSMLIYNAPGFFSRFCYPLIKPWLNPSTRDKVHFVSSSGEGLAKWTGEECLPVMYGGTDDFDYDAALGRGEAITFAASREGTAVAM